MAAEVTDMIVALTIVEKGGDHPDSGKLGKPTIEDLELNLVIGKDPVLQPGGMALHDTIVVGVAPEADEEQTGVPGHRGEFLVIPEFGLDHPRPGHDPLPVREAHRSVDPKQDQQDGSPLSYYVREGASGDKIFLCLWIQ